MGVHLKYRYFIVIPCLVTFSQGLEFVRGLVWIGILPQSTMDYGFFQHFPPLWLVSVITRQMQDRASGGLYSYLSQGTVDVKDTERYSSSFSLHPVH